MYFVYEYGQSVVCCNMATITRRLCGLASLNSGVHRTNPDRATSTSTQLTCCSLVCTQFRVTFLLAVVGTTNLTKKYKLWPLVFVQLIVYLPPTTAMFHMSMNYTHCGVDHPTRYTLGRRKFQTGNGSLEPLSTVSNGSGQIKRRLSLIISDTLQLQQIKS